MVPTSEAMTKLAARFPALLDRPYIMILSRLLPTKGLDVFIDAFLSIVSQSQFKEWRLVLAGEGPEEYVQSLKRKIRADAADNVLFPGWLEGDEKEAVLRHASLLALPSYHENFGLCVMESLACGVPVLISPHVNLAPEILEAQAGWIAAVDRDSLEAALSQALSSDAELKRRGDAGLKLSTCFDWPVVATRLTELYASVLKDTNRSPATRPV
jgi:glycosyltransferase involved in cell wall biosynthesis